MRPLTDAEKRVILNKGTEQPFTGRFNEYDVQGLYICRQCGAALYRSEHKFKSGCGWPSFDDEIPGAVRREPDSDGHRTEILCAACSGHLGHIFLGENLTEKNTRHCVNSISMDFIAAPDGGFKTAIFASGCFWGTEYHFEKAAGVLYATSGYTGGKVENPTYRQVSAGMTGHLEAVQVVYDPTKTTYEALAKLYFESHDFTQTDGQGPDIGSQYLSAIFYSGDDQKAVAEKLIGILKTKGYTVATTLRPATVFYPAEGYHQNYYETNGKTPYCHIYRKIFD